MSNTPSESQDMAALLRAVLEPVLAPVSAGRHLGEISAALEVARVGAWMSHLRPSWLQALDRACATYQSKLRSATRSQAIALVLEPGRLPRPLRSAAVETQSLAREEASRLERTFQQWRESEEGVACRVALRKALKQGGKSKPLYLPNTQIDECLRRAEASMHKAEKKLRQQVRWKSIREHGRAAQRLRQTQQIVCLLGHELVSDKLNEAIAKYRVVAQTRRAARWLREMIETSPLDVESSSAAGALWFQVYRRQQQVSRELLLDCALDTSAAATPVARKPSRPALPLAMKFG
ncbi:MAG: hypothetical protein ACPGSC_13370, partial [Granulosicoccaceae bacterium]